MAAACWGLGTIATKFVLDVLNKIVYLDDAQIVELYCSKQYSHYPKTLIEIEELS